MMKLTRIETSMRDKVEFVERFNNAKKQGIQVRYDVTENEGQAILRKVTRKKNLQTYTRDGKFYAYAPKNKYLCCPGIKISRILDRFIVHKDNERCDTIEIITFVWQEAKYVRN